ncbi:pentatricopeptide repeat-containing protein At1g02060, chloroplastic-like [Zingiber officinale]|uniref:pentatricopeptide repeat-containing protein At1g02060, chloroplastic-like n=1 Tax=Zingiber officinale TaxID=94328 RepID=UPI001C4C84CE|nr:pentatricopeptide repeat-containing protein At1g02060, chloroplastic-like [Zingiber officinale]
MEDKVEEPITLLKRMLQRNMMLDDIACSLNVYSKKRMVNEVFDGCRYFSDHGLDVNIIGFNTMLLVSQRSDQNNLAWKIFKYMFVYSKKRMVNEVFDACKYFGDHGLDANIIGFNTILLEERIEEVVQMMEEMVSVGLKPYDEAYNHLIVATVVRCLPADLHCSQTLVSKYDPNRYFNNEFVTLVAKLSTSLLIILMEIEPIADNHKKNQKFTIFPLYSTILPIDVCALLESADNKYTERVASKHASIVEVVLDMHEAIFPGHRVFDHLLQVYSKKKMVNEEERIEEAIQMMEEMVSVGLKPYDETYNHLIVGLLRNGWTNQCLRYSEKMLEGGYLPDLGTCNEMIKTLYIVGNIEEVNRILTSLLNMRLVPNQEIYLILIDVHRSLMPLRPSPLLPNSRLEI